MKANTLTVVASGSRANCYLLNINDRIIIIEAGVTIACLKKALNFDFSKVAACLVTHEHQDHAKCVRDLLKIGIPVYCSKGTAIALNIEENYNYKRLEAYKKIVIDGGTSIYPIEAQHDANEPLCFAIKNNTIGTLLFATDTYYIKDIIKNVNHLFIECNYDSQTMENNKEISFKQRNRLLVSHCELQQTKAILKANANPLLANVLLLHASQTNLDTIRAKSEIKEELKEYNFNLKIAKKGIELDLAVF